MDIVRVYSPFKNKTKKTQNKAVIHTVLIAQIQGQPVLQMKIK